MLVLSSLGVDAPIFAYIRESYSLLLSWIRCIVIFYSKISGIFTLLNMLVRPNYGSRKWRKLSESTVNHTRVEPEDLATNGFLLDVIASVLPSRSVFEVGCGAGPRLKVIKRKYPHLEVRGVEINPHAVNQGNIELREIGGANETIECGDITRYNNSITGSYSVVLSWAVLMYIHPLKIRSTLRKLFSSAEEVLIIIEPSSSGSRWNCLPARNRSFLHDYFSLLRSLNLDDFIVTRNNIPRKIWSPGYGNAEIFILDKRKPQTPS